MSADFPVAIGFGATHVRVGTAIFGTRPAARLVVNYDSGLWPDSAEQLQEVLPAKRNAPGGGRETPAAPRG